MSKQIILDMTSHIKELYDFIPYSNWGDSPKGPRPAPYAQNQRYEETDPIWDQSLPERVGIRLNNMVLVDYDGNKPEAVSEIPSVLELALALGFDDAQDLIDKALIQWNFDFDSLHFMFVQPDGFDPADFKQSNQGTKEFFWKHIDIKTGNQLCYLKSNKEFLLNNPLKYCQAPDCVMEELRDKAVKTLAEDFDTTIVPTEHQFTLAENWFHDACEEMQNTADGQKNGTLNVLACTTAGLVAGGALDNQGCYTLLYEAAINAGCEEGETLATMESGWNEGFATPRRDAPYQKSILTAEEVFADRKVTNTNVDVKHDSELTESVQQGNLDESDPNLGILYDTYKYFQENWVTDASGKYIAVDNLVPYVKSAFNTMHTWRMPVKPGSRSGKKFIPSEVFDGCNPVVVADLMYKPGDVKLITYEGIDYLNSYIPYLPERPDDAEVIRIEWLIRNHLDWLFEHDGHKSFVLDWLAWQVQHTGELVGWVPLIMGCRGDGKSILFELVTSAIGSRNTKMMGNKSVKSEFQDWAKGSSCTAFEEIHVEGRESKQVANDLKQFITETRINVNPKGKTECIIPNFANYIAFSNESDPLTIASSDRRWYILETKHFGKNTVTYATQNEMKQHFDDIKDAVNHEKFHSAIHWMLRDHVISDEFLDCRFRAPDTDFGDELCSQTYSEKENRLQEYLDNATFVDGREGRLIDHPDGFQIKDFRPNMPDNWFQHSDKKPSDKMLGKMLRNMGYEKRPRIKADSGLHYTSFKR